MRPIGLVWQAATVVSVLRNKQGQANGTVRARLHESTGTVQKCVLSGSTAATLAEVWTFGHPAPPTGIPRAEAGGDGGGGGGGGASDGGSAASGYQSSSQRKSVLRLLDEKRCVESQQQHHHLHHQQLAASASKSGGGGSGTYSATAAVAAAWPTLPMKGFDGQGPPAPTGGSGRGQSRRGSAAAAAAAAAAQQRAVMMNVKLRQTEVVGRGAYTQAGSAGACPCGLPWVGGPACWSTVLSVCCFHRHCGC